MSGKVPFTNLFSGTGELPPLSSGGDATVATQVKTKTKSKSKRANKRKGSKAV